MKKNIERIILLLVFFSLLINLTGCTSLKKKFTRKKKKEEKKTVYFQVRKYDIKPSMELYEKHYVFWINWNKELLAELGKNFKSDIRSSQETVGNLEDMSNLLVDEKAQELAPHIADIKQAKTIIDKQNMTKSNETRIRIILERELRTIKRKFSPKKMEGFIRKEWKQETTDND